MAKVDPVLRGEYYYLRRRVPKRYASIEPRTILQICLFTDSKEVARSKARRIWDQLIEAWEAKLEGRDVEGEARLASARGLAHKRGYRYLDIIDVAKLPIEEVLTRVERSFDSKGRVDKQEADALLGLPPKSGIKVSEAVEHFYQIADERVIGKSDDQLRRHKNPRLKATKEFIKAVSDKPLAEITAEDMFEFRKHLSDRVRKGEIKGDSANKDLTYLLAMWAPVAQSKGFRLGFNSEGLRLRTTAGDETRPPFSEDWIRTKLLPVDALMKMNDDARLLLLAMINTGFRPSEGAGLLPDEIRLDDDVPHIVIQPNANRTLKNPQSKRNLPLVGVSLEAFKQARNGFPRYAQNSASLSATVNKFLRENGLLETTDHSLYSLRHALEDRMLRAGIDERVRMDILGHQIKRERYGEGGGLAFVRDQLLKVAL